MHRRQHRQRIVRPVRAAHADAEFERRAADLGAHRHAGIVAMRCDQPRLGSVAGAEADDAARAGGAGAVGEHVEIGIVGIQHGNAAGRQPVEDLGLRRGDVVETVEKAGMAVGDAGDDRDIGLRKAGQEADFAGRVHADFLHRR